MRFTSPEEATDRIRAEYMEMPGLSLTVWQAQRLWNMSDDLCVRALLTLVHTKFLMLTSAGTYVRRAGSPAREATDVFTRAS
jgi:hypothetical protein